MRTKEVNKPKVAWLIGCPSGDQIDFLRELARRQEIALTVFYCSSTPTKGGLSADEPSGRGVLLGGISLRVPGGKVFVNPGIVSHILSKEYDLVVVGGYNHPTMLLAMIIRNIQGRKWIL